MEPSLFSSEPAALVEEALARFGTRAPILSSFSAEDCLVIHLAHATGRPFRVVTLDTGRLPEETHEVIERVRAKYRVDVEVLFPERAPVEELVRIQGPFGFRGSLAARKECCRVRKLEPLARALDGADAWITGLRQVQSTTRAALRQVDTDERGLVKLAPLAHVDDDALWAWVKRAGVPVHELHDRGYPSIGCAPCTRAVQPGESVRAGRWWWESPEHKECGLHAR